ncbi:MAG: SPFH/Band 7/PHB domain protein [Kiritimatiellae bacterium]|nr:SPFH/Band 7/PHB domain protein [Kiritimatiellia bacterium]MBP5787920.1 SPFH/Band 7/PHB domain protein [Kiritimatiellia bacterium]MBQ9343813.1 SPFH/Band 7/PHB domain protein [Kiritimatiellia bacterium]
MEPGFVITMMVLALLVIVTLFKGIRIVPQKQAWIVERLGKYHETLNAGLHLLIPYIDKVAYRIGLKEVALDVPPQQCVTRDNITVEIDGILYLQVIDPVRASYGIANYVFACSQLAQTTLRSEVGKLELDRTFEERASINAAICSEVDKASDPWGVKITRYEIKTITPPPSVLDAMEKQMRAEREKRAAIAESEGERQSKINRADGDKQEKIAWSEGEKTRRINEAEGRAQEILLVAEATANGIRQIANAIANTPGGMEAMNLKVAEQYIGEFGKIAKAGNTMILPTDLANVAGFIKAATSVVKSVP